jgi:hypothetical protein
MIEDKTRERGEIIQIIDMEQIIISNYLDTFELSPIVKSSMLTTLVDAEVKKYANKKNIIVSSLQYFITRRDAFIKKSIHDENIELAFINENCNDIISLWCDKHEKSYLSLHELFPALEFFIEKRTIEFIKKYSDVADIFQHIGCMYSIQIIIALGLHDKSLPMYDKELLNKEYQDKLQQLLLKTKAVFKQFMIHVYRNCLPKLSDDILVIIIDYNYLNYNVL